VRVTLGVVLGVGLGLPVAAVALHARGGRARAVDAPARPPAPPATPARIETWTVIPGEDWHGLGRPPEPAEEIPAPDAPAEVETPRHAPRKRVWRHHAEDADLTVGANGAPIIP
jgi:hypothetical protein